jgi:hypothetical protein
MKYVKEHINEVFEKDSDPIHDLGIGGFNPVEKYKQLIEPVIDEFKKYIWQLKGKRIKGKFRLSHDINSKKYNVTTEKIKDLHYRGKTFVQSFNDMNIIFIDEEDKEYHYFFKDGEKFFVED